MISGEKVQNAEMFARVYIKIPTIKIPTIIIPKLPN